ncbi:ArgS-related anticodon-binding protein NrtL [Streptomyces sp. DH24]|uniref:ArgS-related anticodon-binding protein NrtL n=1 Tax=Streptomyces sp. DH24 TaxID=3040123 RepID=UPI00244246B9|nr:DALR anticodon-binding domain-containing protein [Streptomyces sp. DH24]MDG9716521.1 DALR anticodon-binding domain-containing protein [Streptomyces sp. DH24]
MTPVELSRTVLHAVRRAVDGGELSVTVPERVVVGPPGPGGCGDYATNVALRLARPAGQPPLRVAGILRAHLLDLGPGHAIEDVVVTPPGFINIRLCDTAPALLVEEILRLGARYGHAHEHRAGGALPDGHAAPTRLSLHAPREIRALVVMDVATRLLRAQGADVRVACDAPPEAEWLRTLGLDLGPHEVRQPLDGDIRVRPVPAPADPTSLGRDAARWALLYPAPHDRPRIGEEHLVQRESNPLFRVRYAHARTRALLRNAADLGFTPEPGPLANPGGSAGTAATAPGHTPGPALTAITAPTPLLTSLADHPRILRVAATAYAPDRLARHLVDVADAVLSFLPVVLPVGEEKPSAAHRARLALAEAAGTVLAGGLSLLGIDAPDHL